MTATRRQQAAARQYGYAEREARHAAGLYVTAAGHRRAAADLTRHPARQAADFTPARLEADAAACERLADMYLGCYWRYVDQARQMAAG